MSKTGYGDDTAEAWKTRRTRLATSLRTGEIRLVPAYDEAQKRRVDQYPDFTREVNAGASWLDSVSPGWDARIDLSRLDLDDENMCVLGQSWDHYAKMRGLTDVELPRLGNKFASFVITARGENDWTNFAPAHGFAISEEVCDWVNLEGVRRVGWTEDSELNCLTPGLVSAIKQVGAEIWEHLTITWVMLIQARQQVRTSRAQVTADA